jgi:hypothetical protein
MVCAAMASPTQPLSFPATYLALLQPRSTPTPARGTAGDAQPVGSDQRPAAPAPGYSGRGRFIDILA